MKKIINYLILVLIVTVFKTNCYAITDTYVRSKDNMRVPKDVVVDSNNYNAIINTPSISSSEKIYDFVGVLSDSQKKKLHKDLSDYIKLSGYDVAIVITNDLNGKSISNYAYNFYDYNDFKKEGTVFVIYYGNDPSIYMGNVGPSSSRLFAIYNDTVINSTLKYIYDNSISKGNYYEACVNYVKIINGFYEKKSTKDYKVNADGKIVKSIPILELFIISFAVTSILVVILITKNKKKSNNKYDIDNNVDKSLIVIRLEYDKLIDNVAK